MIGGVVTSALRLGSSVVLDLNVIDEPVEVLGFKIDTIPVRTLTMAIDDNPAQEVTAVQIDEVFRAVGGISSELGRKLKFTPRFLRLHLNYDPDASMRVRQPRPAGGVPEVTLEELFGDAK